MMISFTPETEHLLQAFIILAGVLLIPVVVGVIVILFKLSFLIHSASDFLHFATYELTPVVKDLRALSERLTELTEKTASGFHDIGNSFGQTGPLLKQGAGRLKDGLLALVSTLGRSFLSK